MTKTNKINLLATVAGAAIAMGATTAHAQIIGFYAPPVFYAQQGSGTAPVVADTTPTYDPDANGTASDPVVTLIDPEDITAGTQSEITYTRDVVATNSDSNSGSTTINGQAGSYDWSASVDVSSTETSTQTTTSIPDGEGGFDVTPGTPTVWATSGDPVVSNVTVDGSISTDVDTMYSESITTLNPTNDGTADVAMSGGVVTTDSDIGTQYYEATGTAVYDDPNSEIDVTVTSYEGTAQNAHGFFAESGDATQVSATGQTADGFFAVNETEGDVQVTEVTAAGINVLSGYNGEDFANVTSISSTGISTAQINGNGVDGALVLHGGTASTTVTLDNSGMTVADTTNGTTFSVDNTGAAFIANGLDMNDKVISNVANGVAAGDAVNKGQLDAEAAARAAADTAEAAARVAGDAATLASANTYTDGKVATEAAARIAADTVLTTRIATEETTRAAADTVLTTRIATEETTRAAADTVLTTRIAAEETARATAITNEANARIAADTAETNARIAADNALGTRITNETNERVAADNLLRDQISSSTATAIALGGSTILPDSSFSLSGNVGFYQGATAVAMNVTAKIGEKAYLTGAVGGGLNKSGKVGGRVGFVFGF